MEIRLLGALVVTSIGVSVPPAVILPVITLLVALRMASAPPTAVTYFSRMESAVGGVAPAGAAGVAAGCGAASDSMTCGTLTGRVDPRWHELQVTWRRPRKLSLLIMVCMAIISRAVFFSGL